MDRDEILRRGKTPRQPTITKGHAYAAIQHRVIDSPAFADLTSTAVKVLLLLARQLTKENNNGHLQATFSFMKKYGIGSEHTLKDALDQLTSHGFIYKTRSHGANKAWARYAVTWLAITNKEGLFLGGYVPCAWWYWEPEGEKAPRKKCRTLPAKNAVSTPDFRQKLQQPAPQKLQTMYLVPVVGDRRRYKPRGCPHPALCSPNAIHLGSIPGGNWKRFSFLEEECHDEPNR